MINLLVPKNHGQSEKTVPLVHQKPTYWGLVTCGQLASAPIRHFSSPISFSFNFSSCNADQTIKPQTKIPIWVGNKSSNSKYHLEKLEPVKHFPLLWHQPFCGPTVYGCLWIQLKIYVMESMTFQQKFKKSQTSQLQYQNGYSQGH
jgi:hypothetical protein